MPSQTGFRLEVQDGVYIYHVSDIDRDTVDQLVATERDQWDRAMQNNNHALRVWVIEKVLYPTPYLSTKMEETLQAAPPDLNISTAVVVNDATQLRVMSLFLQRLMHSRLRTEFQIVHSLADALAWVADRRTQA